MLTRLGFPHVAGHARFVAALGIDALGSGIWLPLSLLYFLRTTDVGLVDLGVAMTTANLVVLPVVPVVGQLVDAVGPRRMIQAGNVVQCLAFALYPLAESVVWVGVLVAAATLGRTMFWGAHGPMVAQITKPGERELWYGFLQATRNAGMGVGGVLAAVALAIDTDAAYHAVALGNATSYALAFVLMAGVRGGDRAHTGLTPATGGWGLLARDRAYLVLVAVIFCYVLAEMTLNVAMPVYFAEMLGLPGWVPGAVFVVNTVMIGLGQGVVVRLMTGRVRTQVMLGSVVFTGSSFVLFYAADALSAPVALALVLVGAVVYTIGELMSGPVIGALAAEAAPEEHRGRYMSATQLAWNTAGALAPLLYTALLARGALATWGGAVVLCLVWAALLVPLHRLMPRVALSVTNKAEDPVAG